MPSPTEIRNALLHGLRATTAEKVFVHVEHVLTLVDLDTCERVDLFDWVVETEEVGIEEHKPNSVIPRAGKRTTQGLCQVNREKLLDLIS